MLDKLRTLSPLSLLGLAACGGGGAEGNGGGSGSQSVAQSAGQVRKGLLQNALVVVDGNNNGQQDAGEASTRTNSFGRFQIDNANGAPILILTDDQTIDTATGLPLPGVRMRGSATDVVFTPFTQMSNVDASALATALGLQGIDLLNYDPNHLGAEKASQQLVGTLKVLAGVMDGAGRAGSDTALFGQAFDAMVTVVRDQLAAGGRIGFGDDTLLRAVLTELGLNGDLSSAQRAGVLSQLQELNQIIDDVSALGSDDARGAFSTAVRLADAYEAGIDDGNDIDVAATASNLPPTIALDGALQISETALAGGDRSVGRVDISDDTSGFTVTLTGANAELFAISTTGDITVRSGAEIDFGSAAALSLTIRVTDAQGAVTSRTVDITRQPNEPPTLSISPQGGVLAVDETSIPNGDRVVGTITAADPDGGTPALTLIGPDAGLFQIDGTTLALRDDAEVEGAGSLSVTVIATDALGAQTRQALTISVGQNSAPVLSVTADGGFAVDETLRIDGDRLAGTVSASDPDGEPVTLSLSGTNAGLFEIGDDNKIVLRADAVIDFDSTPSLSFDVVATDSAGNTSRETLEVAVNEVEQSDIQGLDDTLIQGNRTHGSTLTIVNGLSDPDNGADPTNFASVSYQWYLRDTGSEQFAAVDGATSLSFDTTQQMVDQFVAAVITTEDQGGQVDRTIVFFGTVLPAPDEREAPLTITLNARIDQARIDLRADVDEMEAGLSAFAQSISTMLGDFATVLADDALLDAADTTLTADGELSISVAAQGAEVTHQIQVDFDSLAVSTFADFETLVSSIDLSDPATLAVAGQINSMSFTSQAGVFALSYAAPVGGASEAITVSYTPTGAGQDGDVQQINLTGSFSNGIEPLLRALSATQALGDLDAPEAGDFADSAAFEAAQQAHQTAYQTALASALSAVLGGGEQAAVAGLEGIEIKSLSDGALTRQMSLDLFRPDGSGLTTTLGDYQLTIEGTLPTGPAELVPLFQPDTGIFATINALTDGDGGLTLADFNALVNGVDGNAGLKDAGVEDIDKISLKHDSGDGVYEKVLDIDIDLAELAAVWDDFDVDKEVTEHFEQTPTSEALSVAYDVDGVYLVLGEGLEIDQLQSTLSWLLPQTDAAVAS